MKILVLNSGSSSQKSALFEIGPNPSANPLPPLWEGKLDWDGNKETLTVRNSAGKKFKAEARVRPENRHTSLGKMLQKMWKPPTGLHISRDDIAAVGHRIVHGGQNLTEPVLITSEVKRQISEVSSIAPLHNVPGLHGIEYIEKYFPGSPQVAVFDTGFHRTLPDEAKIYAGPYAWYEHGIRRYGFHGINHEYCARRAARMLQRDQASLKIATCHLGNGCSLAAINGGKSVDTTMGFTPLEGLVMGTRGGSLDPGILVHLLRTGTSAADLDNILNRQSGLLGVSGLSSDMRDIVQATRSGNQRATLAFDIFIHRLCGYIAAMTASLQGLDVLVFTAGIGENSAEVRAAACARLGFFGIELDNSKNEAAKQDTEISTRSSRVRILVIRAQEDWSIAQTCAKLLQ